MARLLTALMRLFGFTRGGWRVLPRPLPRRLAGRAYVIDGDGIRLSRHSIRLAGLDAPEQGQPAITWDGRQVDQGEIAKRALINKLRGQWVEVEVWKRDHYGRLVGTVWVGDRDINQELVREGVAYACYGDTYRHDQAQARRERRGMWRNRAMTHPAQWRRNA